MEEYDGLNFLIDEDEDGAIVGTADNDFAVGTRRDEVIRLFDGNDAAIGFAGIDKIIGGAGDDTLIGGRGDDDLRGNTGDDDIIGGLGNDLVNGGGGDDRLRGEVGADTIIGGNGDDTIAGGSGRDEIEGGRGDDIMRGGAAGDSFFFNPNRENEGNDLIVDFRLGRDKVVLNAADVIEATPGLADFVLANGGDTASVIGALDASDLWALGSDGDGNLVVSHPTGSITFNGIPGDGITSFADIGPALAVDGLGEVLTSLAPDAGNPASIAAVVAPSGGTPDDDNSDFDLLLTALNATELTGALANEEASFTVFAPTDAAFISLAQRLGFDGSDESGALDFILGTLTTLGGGNPIPLLTDVLLYHVSEGAKTLGELQNARTVDTLFEDADVRIGGVTVKDQDPDFDDASIILADLQTGNGTIQVIDEVLLPFNV